MPFLPKRESACGRLPSSGCSYFKTSFFAREAEADWGRPLASLSTAWQALQVSLFPVLFPVQIPAQGLVRGLVLVTVPVPVMVPVLVLVLTPVLAQAQLQVRALVPAKQKFEFVLQNSFPELIPGNYGFSSVPLGD